MAGQVNASWALPPPSWLNISDCDAISPWISYFLVTASDLDAGYTAPASSWDAATPVNVVINFLGSLVPSNWTSPTDGDLLLWYLDYFNYIDIDDGETFNRIVSFALQDCGSKVCPNLDFSGDPDLSGIGMMISYYMVAVFVTLYYFALVPGVFGAYGHSFGSSTFASRYRKFASGFEESVTGFLDAMLLFAISMLIAAITRYASLTLHPDESHSLFGLQDCVFLSTFAIFPAFVLQSLSYDIRRRRIRLALWDLVIVFAITVEILYRVYYRSYVDSDFYASTSTNTGVSVLSQMTWFVTCQSENLRQSLQTLLSVGHAVMLANVAAWIYNVAEIYVGPLWIPALQRRARLWKSWETCRLWLRVVNGLFCLTIMWSFLGLFTAYRHDVMTRAGEADEDDDWTFGQVLSLTTWIPVGIELLSVYIYGAQDSVERNISGRYKVIDRNDTKVIGDQVVYEKAPNAEVSPVEAAHHT